MKKIGILDNYISNFHSNTYHKLFHEIAEETGREEYKITHIYAKLDKSPSTNETTAEWCEKNGAIACATPQEVCDAVDVIMILSPNNPELHEEFCEVAFDSGKLVYVDKTFAPNYASAKRIIEMGKAKNANFWSSSATRFEPAMQAFLKEDAPLVNSAVVQCGLKFEIYCIHLVELMNTVMKNGAKSVICRNASVNHVFEITFSDGRRAFLNQFTETYVDFSCCPEFDGKCQQIVCASDFWKSFATALLDYFETGKSLVPVENTLECIAVRDALKKAVANPHTEIIVEGSV